MTYAEILRSLQDRTLTVVAKRTKIHRNTLYRIMNDDVKGRPIPANLEVLSQYLSGTPYEPEGGAAE
ncbi:MAG: hypothetical protein ACRCXM_08815 [Beijerinckiaceae bacterium]